MSDRWIYRVRDQHGDVVADYMTLETATTLMAALMDKYYEESDMSFTIVRRLRDE